MGLRLPPFPRFIDRHMTQRPHRRTEHPKGICRRFLSTRSILTTSVRFDLRRAHLERQLPVTPTRHPAPRWVVCSRTCAPIPKTLRYSPH
jgi:hypothetical protein